MTVAINDSSNPTTSSVGAKLLNMFVSPGDVFDEVLSAPARMITWIVPVCLLSIAGIFMLVASGRHRETTTLVSELLDAGRITQAQGEILTTHWFSTSAVLVCVAAFLGTLWSAVVVWGIARLFLKVSVPFAKALELAGLTGMILVLGSVVTGLLIFALGDANARPALSILIRDANQASTARAALDVFNVFYLWSTAVLSIGLSRLTGVSVKEASFWAFGYWVVLRLGLILLG